MKIKNIISSFLLCMLSLGCEESIHKTLLTEDTNQLVVEGILTNEKTTHLIKLSTPYKTQNEIPTPATGAVIQITEGNNIYTLTELPAASGKYYTPEMRAVVGRIYKLLIKYEGSEYTAQDYAVPVEPLHPLQYSKVNGLYSLDFSTPGNTPNYIDHKISWKNTPACLTGTTCEGEIIFYDLKSIDVNEIFKPKKEEFTFPIHTTVIRKKYSTSPSYQAFLRSMLSETEWRGGIFDVQRADVLTNLSNGAIGFFAISTVVSDTTIIGK